MRVKLRLMYNEVIFKFFIRTAAPPERSEEEEEEQEGEEELINHFLMVIYHGFFRYDGVKLYAVPGGYITNADSVESILWDDQFQQAHSFPDNQT